MILVKKIKKEGGKGIHVSWVEWKWRYDKGGGKEENVKLSNYDDDNNDDEDKDVDGDNDNDDEDHNNKVKQNVPWIPHNASQITHQTQLDYSVVKTTLLLMNILLIKRI